MFGTIMIALFVPEASWFAQLGSILIVGVFTVVVTTILIKLIGLVLEFRITKEDEYAGLDMSAHGERAYDLTS